MRKLFLFMVVSVDGYFEGPNHDISWHNVDAEFNAFAIEQLGEIGMLVFGHRTYDLMAGLKKLATGCDIRQNYRPFIKQGRIKVNHLHFHIQPRENEDALYQQVQRFETDMFKPLPEEEMQRLKSLLG